MSEQRNPMSRQEKAIRDFMRSCLVIPKEEQAIDHILAELGNYYAADRVYIFEAGIEDTHAGCAC